MRYLVGALVAAVISFALTPGVIKLAAMIGAVDKPDQDRKRHGRIVPRLGGIGISVAFITTVLISSHLTRPLIGLLAATVIIVAVGVMDDRQSLSPWVKLVWQVIAAVVALAGGIGVSAISSPFGGSIALDWGRTLVNLGPLRFHITPIANLLSVLWIVGLVNAVNFLDGIDGLACGVSAIASFFIFLLSLSVNQPAVALIAIILFGSAIGFLPFNFAPAKIFLGDSGAYLLGLTLALLAIYSGGKLATAVLVLGFTIVDGLLTVLRRLYHHRSPFKADRSHLHHLLQDAGLSQRQTVAVYYLLAIVLGILALLSGTLVKVIALLLLGFSTAIVVAILIRKSETTGSQ